MQNEDSRMRPRRNLWPWVRWLQFRSWRYSQKKPKETEDNLVQSLKYFSNRREILFPYNFEWVLLSCTHFVFALLDVKLFDSLCLCSFHFILLIISVDEGVVKVMDSKRTPLGNWANMQECLQKAWKRFTANTRGVWKPELIFQPLNVSTTC